MRLLIISFIFIIPVCSLAQSDRIRPLLSSRVDTSKAEVKSILKLYENYLNSNPHTISDNPYWNKSEKKRYKDFDFSRASMFQGGMTTDQLCGIYLPFVMSVEPLGSKYQIRVMYSSSTNDPQYAGSKVWCIQKLNAIQEDGSWVLENLMVELSRNWERKKVGHVQYVYPSNHAFNSEDADKAKQFCDELVKRFNPDFNEPFSYYVTSTVDDMGLLENFDYYFVGITSGKARENMILTAKGNEYYPHEFVHKLLPMNENRGYVMEEGLAVYLGTKQDLKEYRDLLSKLANDLKSDKEKFDFQSIVSQEVRYNGYQTAYPAGAAICELVFELFGDEGLKQLMMQNTSDYNQLVATIEKVTGLSLEEIEDRWAKILSKYSQ